MNIEVIRGDLLDQNVDAIVNSWNRNVIPWWLLIPQGVSGAIKKRAGLQPFVELGRMGPIPLGDARVTCSGRLPFKAIIDVAGINLLWTASEYSIRRSVRSAMAILTERGFESAAFPVIGPGSGGFAQDKAVEIMCDEFGGCKAPQAWYRLASTDRLNRPNRSCAASLATRALTMMPLRSIVIWARTAGNRS